MARRVLAVEIGKLHWRLAVVERRVKGFRIVANRTVDPVAPAEFEEVARSLDAARLPIVCIPMALGTRAQMLDLPLAAWRVRGELVRNKLQEDDLVPSDGQIAYRLWPDRGRLSGIAVLVKDEDLANLKKNFGSLGSNLKKIIPPPVALAAACGAASDQVREKSLHELAVHFDQESLLLTVAKGDDLLLVREVSWSDGGVGADETSQRGARAAAFEEIRRSIMHHDLTAEVAIGSVQLSGSMIPRGSELEGWSSRIESSVSILELSGPESREDGAWLDEYALCMGAASLFGRNAQLDLLRPDPPLSPKVRLGIAAGSVAAVGLALVAYSADGMVAQSADRYQAELRAKEAVVQALDDRRNSLQEDHDLLVERLNLERTIAQVGATSLPLDIFWQELCRRSSAGVSLLSLEAHRRGEFWGATLTGFVAGKDPRDAARVLGHALRRWRESAIVRDLRCRIDPGQRSDRDGGEEECIWFVLDLELES